MRHDNPNFTFLAAILAESAPRALAQLSERGWNTGQLVRIASQETVLAPLAPRLRHLGLAEAVGSDAFDFFEAYRDLNAVRNRQILTEVEEVAFHLNQFGLQPVLLKGLAYLLTGMYADPADRFLLDIDLLFSPTAARAASDLLRAHGYTPDLTQPTDWARDVHLPPLLHPNRTRIELHRDLGHGVAGRILTPQAMIQRSQPYSLGRGVVRIPSPDDLFTHLAIHSQLHHGYSQRIWPPLRALFDLLLLTRHFAHHLDWAAIRENFRRHGQAALLDLHVLQTSAVFQMPLPYPLTLGPVDTLRWARRQLLWRLPVLRYVDPLYLVKSALMPRLQLFGPLLRVTEGRRYLLASPFRLSSYRNLRDALSK